MNNVCEHSFEEIISLENLLEAWGKFVKGKRNKKDMAEFSLNLMDNLTILHKELEKFDYHHGGYTYFKINDPKPRDIHKATVRDRLAHHSIHRILYPYFNDKFIHDSYSSRLGKGTHKAVDKFKEYFYKVSHNNRRTCWVLKCDIRKFFASINHAILFRILRQYIKDQKTLWLLNEVVASFSSGTPGVGLPLGNLTSQLLVNIYLNELDQFVKHKIKAQFYIRFADDFVILSDDKKYLEGVLAAVGLFLEQELKLNLHPDKVSISTFSSGIDFLGVINFPYYRIIRTKTKRRMLVRMKQKSKELEAGTISKNELNQSLQSYLGLLKHNNSYDLKKLFLERYK